MKNKLSAPATVKLTVKQNRTRSKNNSKRSKKPSAPSISSAGTGFLKCTLASPDFGAGSGFIGIPDEYEGRVVTKRHQFTGGLEAYTDSMDQYYVQLPIPGLAYLWGERLAGTTGALTLKPVFYSDTAALFPPTDMMANVSAFRYASNAIEIINTSSMLYAAGSIQAWKGKVTLSDASVTHVGSFASDRVAIIGGLGSLVNSTKPTTVLKSKEGIYLPSFNSESTYEWSSVVDNLSFDHLTTNQSFGGVEDAYITFTTTGNSFAGIGNFEASVIKIPAVAGQTQGVVRTWACVEYQVNPISFLFEYAMMAPAYDPAALAMAKAYYKQVPCGVAYKDNAVFWENFVKWVSRASKVLKYVPGPVGAIAQGVSDLNDIGHGLW